MENLIRQHLNELDKNTIEIDIAAEELIRRFSEANDKEKQEIIDLLILSNEQELLNHPRLEVIREWISHRN